MAAMERLLLVSNRLPVTLAMSPEGVRVERSAGGLATGMREPHERSKGLWFGWPGPLEIDTEEVRRSLAPRFTELGIVPVYLSDAEIRRFYQGFANDVLWPLFHYLTGQVSLRVEGWDEYCAANQRFADIVVEHYRPGDLIWVHDYQLMLVPALIRKRLPHARIGFFLHIPFPSSELFATLPFREELLQGLTGADLIGFHSASYRRHFINTIERLLGRVVLLDQFEHDGRKVRLGVFPMGVDASALAQRAEQRDVCDRSASLKSSTPGHLLLGIDRLDYTKGIPRRLLAFEELLVQHPEWRERVRLVQVAVPSRVTVRSYTGFREEVDGLVGRINGAFGTTNWMPVHYLYRSVSDQDLIALYRAADVMLVTPVRDGMNLVAKEFVATRSDEDGVLVLSEFAGAAEELKRAMLVNPFDIEETGEAYHRALTMSRAERRERMRSLRARVFKYDVHAWVADFLRALDPQSPLVNCCVRPTSADNDGALADLSTAGLPPNALESWNSIAARFDGRVPVLFVDYDGTLTPIVAHPRRAHLSARIKRVLERLARAMPVVVLSGRGREDLMHKVGLRGVVYAGSHGFDISSADGLRHEVAAEFIPIMRGAAEHLRHATAQIEGVLIEEKRFSVAVHYRMAPHADAIRISRAIDDLLAREPRLQKRYGKKVIELRPAVDWDKGQAVSWICRELGLEAEEILLIYLGDDLTDEDAFAALGKHGLSVVVAQSPRPTRAQFSLRGVPEVRVFLERLLDRCRLPERLPSIKPAS
jgi:trehalose 6-phosphate synthase/phosphatase